MPALTQQQFLDLLDRLFPRAFLEPRKLKGTGYELIRAFAQVGARVSTAIQNHKDGAFLLDAQGGTFSTCTVEFYRPNPSPSAPELIMRAGTIVRTSKTGREFVTIGDVEFGEGNEVGTPQVEVRALVASAEYNVKGPITTAGGEELPGEIDTIQTPLQTAPGDSEITFLDATVQVRQIDDATGGMGAGLDQLGADLGIPRQVGESDDAYRERLRQLSDTISPDAVVRLLESLLTPLGVTYEFIELFDPSFAMFYDAPNVNVGSYPATNSFYGRNVTDAFRARYLDIRTFRGAFVVVISNFPSIRDRGIYYNSTRTSVDGYKTPLGRRALPFYDISLKKDTEVILLGVYDGKDFAKESFLLGIQASLEAIKPTGVDVTVLVHTD